MVWSYRRHGHGADPGVLEENLMVLLAEFYVGPNASPGWGPGDLTVDTWGFILIRNGETDTWVVDDAGGLL